MEWYQYLLGAVLIVGSIVLTTLVLMQEGKQQGIGVVTGGIADSYMNKTKSRTNQARLERVTKYLAIGFFIAVLAAFLILLFV